MTTSPAAKPTQRDDRRPALAAANFGVSFAAAVGGLSYLGYRMDQRAGDGLWWTLGGALLGLVYGGYELWKLIKFSREDNDHG